MRVVSFLLSTHSFTYSATLDLFDHSYRTSSKPSSLEGMVNLVKLWLSARVDKSGTAIFLNTFFFSSSVSCTTTSSSSALASSLASSGSSSLASSSSPSLFLLAALRASSAFFFFSSKTRLRSSSAAFFFLSSSTLFFFSARMISLTLALYSAVGSPMMTAAVFLKLGRANFERASLRSWAKRFALNSGTMKFWHATGAMLLRRRLTDMSSISRMPNFMSGLSFDGP
mmetsp:Transcript_111309/g.279923  ORF Transcript_111309/g.279923 Transcript_111309/m.279923 type:complete len:227 (-) Transcript_111309:139-819(-)